MRLTLLSLLLLTAAAPALADPPTEEPAKEAEQPRAPEPRADPPRRSDPLVRRGEDFTPPRMQERAEAPEPRLRVADSAPPSPAPQQAPRARTRLGGGGDGPQPRRVRGMESTARLEAEAPVASPSPVRDVAGAAIRQSRGERWNRPSPGASSLPQPTAGTEGWRERNRGRPSRVRDIPPTGSSPAYGSAIPNPTNVVQPSREVTPGSVAGRELRDRIAAEGLRRDRLEREHWRRDWRQDRRYDWRRHRDRDRARFHLGIYIDPFGWRYRDYDIGWRLPARYYSSRYWIADPWYYRLPPVGGHYRWIRYHDDVLLIDLRSGRVLDRIPGFFW